MSSYVLLFGFVAGVVFGVVAQHQQFCTVGAISDAVNLGYWQKMRVWLIAIAVAIAGTQIMAANQTIDLEHTFYTNAQLPWLALVVGGLLFGAGMTLASGCGNKILLRLAAGNLKSLIVLFFLAFSAIMTLRGILAPLRVYLLQASPFVVQLPSAQTLPHLLSSVSSASGLTLPQLQYGAAILVAGPIFLVALLNKDFWQAKSQVLAGLILGLTVVSGWWITGHFSWAENPDNLEMQSLATYSKQAESFAFVGPLANGMELLSRWTDSSLHLTWGIVVALGVFCGAVLTTLYTRTFRWESFNSGGDLMRHILGAILMGFGGVTAGGCSIGQGITGVSTLAVGSFIALFAIIFGSALTMKIEYWRMN